MFNKRQFVEYKAKALSKILYDFSIDHDHVRFKQREAALNTHLKKFLKNKGLKSGFEEFMLDDWVLI